jgi:hypothetical protein
MFLAKQDIKNVPFQILHEKVFLAGKSIVDMLTETHRKGQEKRQASLLKAHNEANPEAPFEGNMEIQYTPLSKELLASEKEEAEIAAFTKEVETLGLKKKSAWLLPQVAAYISNMKYPKNEKGKIDPYNFLVENFSKDSWHKGLYKYLTAPTRGLIVPNQYGEASRKFSALVPLLMMPNKSYNGVPYSVWDREKLNLVVDKNLYKAMTFEGGPCPISKEELLEIRSQGLRVKSGKEEGKDRSPVSTFQLYGIQSSALGQFTNDKLVQIMLTQIWVAHPSNRVSEMILDYTNWDNMPDPIIDTEVIQLKTEKSTLIVDELPWE